MRVLKVATSLVRTHRHHHVAASPPPPRSDTPGLLEARQARRSATDGLRSVIDRGPEVREAARKVEDHGRRNHFFDLLDLTLPTKGPAQ